MRHLYGANFAMLVLADSVVELDVMIANLTKNRPDGRFLKLWLCTACGSRTDLQELAVLGQEIENAKDLLLT